MLNYGTTTEKINNNAATQYARVLLWSLTYSGISFLLQSGALLCLPCFVFPRLQNHFLVHLPFPPHPFLLPFIRNACCSILNVEAVDVQPKGDKILVIVELCYRAIKCYSFVLVEHSTFKGFIRISIHSICKSRWADVMPCWIFLLPLYLSRLRHMIGTCALRRAKCVKAVFLSINPVIWTSIFVFHFLLIWTQIGSVGSYVDWAAVRRYYFPESGKHRFQS